MRRLDAGDLLNIRVALTAHINECIIRVRDATSQDTVDAWSHEAASYITTQHRLASRGRRGDGLSDVSQRQVSSLAAAILAAVTRLEKP